MAICYRLVIFVFAVLWSSTSNGQELVKVPVQIPSMSPASGAFAIARDRGYYRQEGLDVQLVLIPTVLGMQALLSGNIKVPTQGGSGLLPILRGATVRHIFTTFNRSMFWLYSRLEIRSVEMLKGKKIGVSGIGSGPFSGL